MKFLVIFLAVLAMGRADSENSEVCNEERAEKCVDSLLSSLLGDTTEEDVCRELRSSLKCLREAVEECLGEEDDDEVEEGLQELEKLLKENCEENEQNEESEQSEETDDDDEEMKKCFEENEDYVDECIVEGSIKALEHLADSEEPDENTVKCLLYAFMSGCFVERVGEKCGEKAAELAKEELNDLPEEIREACEAAGDIEITNVELLGLKKKK